MLGIVFLALLFLFNVLRKFTWFCVEGSVALTLDSLYVTPVPTWELTVITPTLCGRCQKREEEKRARSEVGKEVPFFSASHRAPRFSPRGVVGGGGERDTLRTCTILLSGAYHTCFKDAWNEYKNKWKKNFLFCTCVISGPHIFSRSPLHLSRMCWPGLLT